MIQYLFCFRFTNELVSGPISFLTLGTTISFTYKRTHDLFFSFSVFPFLFFFVFYFILFCFSYEYLLNIKIIIVIIITKITTITTITMTTKIMKRVKDTSGKNCENIGELNKCFVSGLFLNLAIISGFWKIFPIASANASSDPELIASCTL